MPQAADFIIEEPAPTNPFEMTAIRWTGIAQYRKDGSPGNQVHVKGVVTYQKQGEVELFLQDATGGLQVKSTLTEAVAPGQVVEAVGFPAVEKFPAGAGKMRVSQNNRTKGQFGTEGTAVADLQERIAPCGFCPLCAAD